MGAKGGTFYKEPALSHGGAGSIYIVAKAGGRVGGVCPPYRDPARSHTASI